MEPIYTQLTVYFEDPFWVGVLERRQKDLKIGRASCRERVCLYV